MWDIVKGYEIIAEDGRQLRNEMLEQRIDVRHKSIANIFIDQQLNCNMK
jgi:hypothetical protein